MVEDLRIKQFEKFYYFLMKEAPKNYTPWFFPCEPNGKNPSPNAILKIDPSSKGSWHHEKARLNKEQVIEHIKQGYNIGLSAREGDPLIIIDIDEQEYLNQVPKNTLTATSRKRAGVHAFCWDKDGTAKINLPTDYGEIRSSNQYVLSCGSYVSFNLKDKKDKKVFDDLPKEAREDRLLGYYTIKNSIHPKEIAFNELPKFFKEKEMENIKAEAKIKNKNEEKNYLTGGKYDELFKLKVSDIVGLIPSSKRKGHPLHESDTDANFSLDQDGSIAHCWRHLVSLNAVQYLCVQAGYKPCVDCGTPHKGRGISKIKGDKKALEIAYKEAIKLGLIEESKSNYNKEGLKQTTIFRQLASDFYKKQPYFFDNSRVWWLWNSLEYCWEVKDEVDIMNNFDKYFVQESEKSNIKSGILEALRKQGRMNKPKDIEKSWVQFKNNIYDINTRETFEATSEYFVANPIPWEVGESEETPTMNKLFSTWVDEKDIDKLYELMAFTTVPEMFIHSFIFLFSPPGMGKGTFVNMLLNFIGTKNSVSTSMNRINANPRFETNNWNKKLLITMSEVSNVNDLKNSGLINQATGGDQIRGEVKGGGGFDFVNYGKFIYPTNKLLKVDPEDGFGRRVRIIKFKTRFEREKDVLSKIPEIEYRNLAKKCLRIAGELYKERRFTGDVDISERMNNYQEESKTPLEKFIDNNCDIDNFEDKILLDEFFSIYLKHLKESGGRQINKPNLAKELKKLGWETKREFQPSTQTNLDGTTKRELVNYVLGISFVSGVSGISPKTHSDSMGGAKWDSCDTLDTPDTTEGIDDDVTEKTIEMYKKLGFGDEAEDVSNE